jgi:hypothetical protein
MALANAALGAVHGFAGPIGGMFPAPHGAVCARLLPEVMAANVAALRARAPQSPGLRALPRGRADRDRHGRGDDRGRDRVTCGRSLTAELAIRDRCRVTASTAADLPELVARGQRASSMKGNPIALTDDELLAVLTSPRFELSRRTGHSYSTTRFLRSSTIMLGELEVVGGVGVEDEGPAAALGEVLDDVELLRGQRAPADRAGLDERDLLAVARHRGLLGEVEDLVLLAGGLHQHVLDRRDHGLSSAASGLAFSSEKVPLTQPSMRITALSGAGRGRRPRCWRGR